MIPAPTGATRLHIIIGDPIAQVRAPAGVSRA
ncbi:MAG: shikimate dehydrogenase, partial [Bradyrhizobium sp.]|nr:shikimate dehydrogenase [Bradyrhizobium sp.]